MQSDFVGANTPAPIRFEHDSIGRTVDARINSAEKYYFWCGLIQMRNQKKGHNIVSKTGASHSSAVRIFPI